jgi:hypothetical protein
MNSNGDITEKLCLRTTFNNPASIYRRGALDEFLYGFTAEPSQAFDKFFTQEVFDLILISKVRNHRIVLTFFR